MRKGYLRRCFIKTWLFKHQSSMIAHWKLKSDFAYRVGDVCFVKSVYTTGVDTHT